jgi:hypothetical protein
MTLLWRKIFPATQYVRKVTFEKIEGKIRKDEVNFRKIRVKLKRRSAGEGLYLYRPVRTVENEVWNDQGKTTTELAGMK